MPDQHEMRHVSRGRWILYEFLAVAGFRAQQAHELATTGPYAKVRHPQYDAFILITFGFLLQWPTLLTLLMFPVLVWMYVKLAHAEELDALAMFGDEYRRYLDNTPSFIPGRKKAV